MFTAGRRGYKRL